MRRFALIAAYEPDEGLIRLVHELSETGFEVVVVDDGGGQDFRGLFRSLTREAVVLSYGYNHGKGYALRLGLAYIAEHASGEFVVVTLDASGCHSVVDAVRVAEVALVCPDSLVLGACEQVGRGPLRNRLARRAYRRVSGRHLRDTQTGLRAFTSRHLPVLLDVEGERYEYETAVLLACAERGIEVVEVVASRGGRRPVRSHFRPLADTARVIGTLLRFSFVSFGGVPSFAG